MKNPIRAAALKSINDSVEKMRDGTSFLGKRGMVKHKNYSIDNYDDSIRLQKTVSSVKREVITIILNRDLHEPEDFSSFEYFHTKGAKNKGKISGKVSELSAIELSKIAFKLSGIIRPFDIERPRIATERTQV